MFFGDLIPNNTKEGEIMLIHLIEAFKRSDQVVIEETLQDFVFKDGLREFPIEGGATCHIVLKKLTGEEISIQGDAQAMLNLQCDRCTKEVGYNLIAEFNRTIRLMNEDECAYLDGVDLDIIKFLNIEFLSEFPQKILCSEECKGLCYECGCDLNVQECTCDRSQVDIRMAHLKDLFDSNFKEV